MQPVFEIASTVQKKSCPVRPVTDFETFKQLCQMTVSGFLGSGDENHP